MMRFKATFATRQPSRRQPSSETGIYLRTHKHVWRESGTVTWPSGTVEPTFDCYCGARIASRAVVVKPNDTPLAAG